MAVNKTILVIGFSLLLGACSSSGGGRMAGGYEGPMNTSQGYYKVGKPYDIKGVTYTPAWDPNYDETGIASWYAGEFTGQPTANGELYDPNQLTAAHRTLPLPSLVRVTNLENGRALIVRLNDRGPYAQNRIIDLSRRCAQLLGMEQKGTAKVRVQILAKESLALADAARHGQLATSVADAIETNPTTAPPVVAGNEAVATPEIGSEPQPVQNFSVAPRIEKETLPAPTTLSPAPPTQAERHEKATPLADAAGGLKVVNEKAVITQETGETLPGKSVGGRYLPPQKVQKEKVGKTKIYVQAGAFSQLDNANKMRDRLHTLGTQILPVTVNGKQLYRVRVGPLANVPSADAELQRVIDAGASEAKIVVE
jgi:rare lipoprotein A